LPADELAAAAWRLSIEGFAVGMAFAVSARMFSGFLGIEPALSYSPVGRATRAREWAFAAGAAAWAVSVLLGAAGAAFGRPAQERAGDILFAAGAIPLALQLGLARTGTGPAIDRTRDPLFPFGARAAYALLAAGALVGAAASAADLAGWRVHSLWFDARRHLITIGFLLTLIATMAGRLAPGFAGRPLALPGLRTFAMLGFAASAVLRALEAVAGQWGPSWLLWLSALSGTLAAAALFALAASVGATILPVRPAR
ncbi:MAG: NnrS family protein, partial [Myxococcales bacterium]